MGTLKQTKHIFFKTCGQHPLMFCSIAYVWVVTWYFLPYPLLNFETLNADLVLFRTLKDENIFEISSYKRTQKTETGCIFLKSFFMQGMANLSFSLKERQNSARFNCAAVIISKMTSRSCEERNCFKGLSLFFLTTTSNIAPTFPTNTELIGCLEGSRELKLFCSSLQRIYVLPINGVFSSLSHPFNSKSERDA